jgi:hypothetical protein
MPKKEGFKRLSVAAAAVTPVVVFFSILLSIRPPAEDLPRVAWFSLVCGLFAWGLVRIVAWIIDGFGQAQ